MASAVSLRSIKESIVQKVTIPSAVDGKGEKIKKASETDKLFCSTAYHNEYVGSLQSCICKNEESARVAIIKNEVDCRLSVCRLFLFELHSDVVPSLLTRLQVEVEPFFRRQIRYEETCQREILSGLFCEQLDTVRETYVLLQNVYKKHFKQSAESVEELNRFAAHLVANSSLSKEAENIEVQSEAYCFKKDFSNISTSSCSFSLSFQPSALPQRCFPCDAPRLDPRCICNGPIAQNFTLELSSNPFQRRIFDNKKKLFLTSHEADFHLLMQRCPRPPSWRAPAGCAPRPPPLSDLKALHDRSTYPQRALTVAAELGASGVEEGNNSELVLETGSTPVVDIDWRTSSIQQRVKLQTSKVQLKDCSRVTISCTPTPRAAWDSRFPPSLLNCSVTSLSSSPLEQRILLQMFHPIYTAEWRMRTEILVREHVLRRQLHEASKRERNLSWNTNIFYKNERFFEAVPITALHRVCNAQRIALMSEEMQRFEDIYRAHLCAKESWGFAELCTEFRAILRQMMLANLAKEERCSREQLKIVWVAQWYKIAVDSDFALLTLIPKKNPRRSVVLKSLWLSIISGECSERTLIEARHAQEFAQELVSFYLKIIRPGIKLIKKRSKAAAAIQVFLRRCHAGILGWRATHRLIGEMIKEMKLEKRRTIHRHHRALEEAARLSERSERPVYKM